MPMAVTPYRLDDVDEGVLARELGLTEEQVEALRSLGVVHGPVA